MTTLVTGAAGFIGYHVCRALLARGGSVIGIDSVNDYYDPTLKHDRIAELERLNSGRFNFKRVDFSDHEALEAALATEDFDRIVHLGAQPGVRYSLQNPRAYIQSNLVGHLNLMELARGRGSSHLVYASSSSVYGNNEALPFRVEDRVDHPVSLYAATKKSDELMSETYAHLYRIPMTGLRFFTVYGPWGRPDMAPWIFTRKILAGEPIQVFNHGDMRRDFTYIDDIVAGVIACHDNPPPDDGGEKAGGSRAPHRLYNIGNHRSEELLRFISVVEEACGKKAITEMMPMQPGDVRDTYADISAIERDLGYAPTTPIDIGIPRFVEWFREYHAR
ncbi:NAD-dependent epimerase/dehydratase family protein [Sphingomonas cavernae]|uniref:NAD-dependent epimerase/dehydratase family protein n=1 Tax=Sphingomonas cavernae TaxID=2320861 RepID=A0A418WLC4_9SPHN|nr:NAD-dependent epimerase/dehydratase family protein [Sphingomonas cavernae]RJF90800.1 NAD-dependent epimerase/dehydratase family protein [Sphingomonas cavernae]